MNILKNKKGFTLIEMLVCVLTLILITLICTTGMNMAMRSFNESLFESHSQMLESMINTSVGDVLRYSYNVSDDGTGNVTFNNATFGVVNGRIKLDNEDKGYIMLAKNSTEEMLLIGTNVYTDSMFVSDFDLTYDSTTKVFTGSYKIFSGITGQEKIVTFTFKSILESI